MKKLINKLIGLFKKEHPICAFCGKPIKKWYLAFDGKIFHNTVACAWGYTKLVKKKFTNITRQKI